MRGEILSPEQIERLKTHKYRMEGTSLSEPGMQVFWRWLVDKIPTTWAPNTITLVGLLINVGTSLILVFYSPDATQTAPWWAYVSCALGLFVYQTLDALDGKQARRTSSNTPLGELFDHGLDSVSAVFVVLNLGITMLLGKAPTMLLLAMCAVIFCFYLAHWQAYVTGCLRVTKIDTLESHFGVMTLNLISAYNPFFWDYQLPWCEVTLRTVALVAGAIPLVPYTLYNVRLILGEGEEKDSSSGTGSSSITPAVPIVIILLLEVLVAMTTTIYTNNPCLYLISFGFASAKITNELIVAHLTKSDVYILNSSYIGPLVLCLNQFCGPLVNEQALLWLMLLYSTCDFIRYSVNVCGQICDALNIYCFDITRRPRPATSGTGNMDNKSS